MGQKQNNEFESMLNQSMREICLSNETIDDGNKKQRRNRRRSGRNNRGANKSSSKQTQNKEDVVSANNPSAKTSENKNTQRGRTCKSLSNLREINVKLILLTKGM